MASDDPDEISVVMKGVSAEDLFADDDSDDDDDDDDDDDRPPAMNIYDAKKGKWVFGVWLHDDDLPNANTDLLTQSLSGLKDEPSTDFVLAYNSSGQLEAAWRIDNGDGAELEELPKLTPQLASLFVEGKYPEAVEQVSAQLRQLARDQ